MVAVRSSFGLSTLAAVVCCVSLDVAGADMRSDFARPPFEYKPRPLWFWNAPLQTAEIHSIMERSKQSGYCGFGILPSPGMTPAYLSDEYSARYGDALKKAVQLSQKLTLYDEFWFPSGYVGGQLAKKHPDALCKRLDMLAEDVEGPRAYQRAIPGGRLINTPCDTPHCSSVRFFDPSRQPVPCELRPGTVPPGGVKSVASRFSYGHNGRLVSQRRDTWEQCPHTRCFAVQVNREIQDGGEIGRSSCVGRRNRSADMASLSLQQFIFAGHGAARSTTRFCPLSSDRNDGHGFRAGRNTRGAHPFRSLAG